jgi:hypothetical protein
MGKDKKNEEEVSPIGEIADSPKESASTSNQVLYEVTNNKNRTKTIKVGLEYLVFLPCSINPEGKYKKGVPKSVIEHDGFKTQASFFSIKKKGGK